MGLYLYLCVGNVYMWMVQTGWSKVSRQPSQLKLDTCCFLVRQSTLVGLDMEWLALFQDNVTEWDMTSGHGAVNLVLQWGRMTKSPGVSGYDL